MPTGAALVPPLVTWALLAVHRAGHTAPVPYGIWHYPRIAGKNYSKTAWRNLHGGKGSRVQSASNSQDNTNCIANSYQGYLRRITVRIVPNYDPTIRKDH